MSSINYIENYYKDYLTNPKTELDPTLIQKLKELGIINSDIRQYNVGESNYSQHLIQPWNIWIDWDLNPFDADIVKRVLRTKKIDGKSEKESRIEDYCKIIHVCKERIRQLKNE